MIAIDSSVLIAGFASWHEFRARAQKVLRENPHLPAHAALESYSILTRLPAPHRAPAPLVLEFLVAHFKKPFLTLSADHYGVLMRQLDQNGITGGATYDAPIGYTAKAHEAVLVSCDSRAMRTYQALDVQLRLLTTA